MMPLSFGGANSSTIKSHNMSAILLSLLHNPKTSRVNLANEIGVSNATITNLVSELAQDGLIVEEGNTKPNGQVGRPQIMLSIVPEARFSIGVHIDVGIVYIGLVNLIGEIVDQEIFHHKLNDTWESVLSQIVNAIHKLNAHNPTRKDSIVGIGVAASGLVNTQTGTNVYAPNLQWCNVPLKHYLNEYLPYPIFVENNVRAMAFGEAMFGCARNTHAVAFIYGRVGVGAGFVVDGRLFRGAGEGAGEFGHMTFVFNTRLPTKPEKLENLVSEPAIVRLATAIIGQKLTFQEILTRARAGSEELHTLLKEQGGYIGMALANLVNIFNPEMIVLGGIFQQASDIILPYITATVQEYTFANLGKRVKIMVSNFGQDIGMVGSAGLALDAFFYRATRTEGIA